MRRYLSPEGADRSEGGRIRNNFEDNVLVALPFSMLLCLFPFFWDLPAIVHSLSKY